MTAPAEVNGAESPQRGLMPNRKLLIPFLLLLLLLAACGGGSTTNSAPAAQAATVVKTSFSISASPTASRIVQFTDTTTGSPSSWLWTFGDGRTSTLQNPSHIYPRSGTYTVTLTATGTNGADTTSGLLTVSAESTGSGYNMTLTLSDQAQATTLAFDGLAMITGNLYAQSFFPPGKVADYTGFQYLRDTDPDNMGHNTDFLTRVAYNVIYILTDAQMTQLANLAVAQQSQVDQYGYQRFILMQAFRRTMAGDIPTGSAGLNLNAVKKASRNLYAIDGQISFDRALLYAGILNTMTPAQLAYLDAMKGKGYNEWPAITDGQVAAKMSSLPHGSATLVMTYASDIFSWYAGSVYSDVYFCPERHGTYYGGFYIKDAPAVGQPSYTISEALTNTAGSALIDPTQGYVTQAQATLMSSLVDLQRSNLYAGDNNIVAVRSQVATLLRSLKTSSAASASVNSQVLTLSSTYGDLDGEDNYYYATIFARISAAMTAAQLTKLAELRHSILSGTYSGGTPFDFTVATKPYLYAEAITDLSILASYIANTDYLFFEPTS